MGTRFVHVECSTNNTEDREAAAHAM